MREAWQDFDLRAGEIREGSPEAWWEQVPSEGESPGEPSHPGDSPLCGLVLKQSRYLKRELQGLASG